MLEPRPDPLSPRSPDRGAARTGHQLSAHAPAQGVIGATSTPAATPQLDVRCGTLPLVQLLSIPGTDYLVQVEDLAPDPMCQIHVYTEGDADGAAIQLQLTPRERDELCNELFAQVRGPMCERVIVEAERLGG